MHKFFLYFFLLSFSSLLISQDLIQGSYTYTYGDSESLIEARETCKQLALREAIESYSVFIESSTEIQNYQLKDDAIQTLSTGYLHEIKITNQDEEGRTITMTVQASISPDEVDALLKEKTNKIESNKNESYSDKPLNEQYYQFINEYSKNLNYIENFDSPNSYNDIQKSLTLLSNKISHYTPDSSDKFKFFSYLCFKNRLQLDSDLHNIYHY